MVIFRAILLVLLAASMAAAQDQQTADAETIEAAGFFEFEDRRHAIDLDGCTLTTYVYKDWGEHEKVLWSSFLLDLRFLRPMRKQKDGRQYFWGPAKDGNGVAVFIFNMAPGSFARHEMAMRRNPKPPYVKSPRDGVDDYIYKDKTNFVIAQFGHQNPDQADLFITSLEQYRLDYCFPLG